MPSVTGRLRAASEGGQAHCAGSIDFDTLQLIEELVGPAAERTAETGCGRSTVLFSQLSGEHWVFCVDDSAEEGSSVVYFRRSRLTNHGAVHVTFGPTQESLCGFAHAGLYDAVLLDGPHGYPFPDLEYFHFYPRIREGGLLIVDDVQIPTIGRMADVLQEDAMWDLVALSGKTAIFRRTTAEAVPPNGDHWWAQDYNRRRTDISRIALDDGHEQPSFAERLSERATVAGSVTRLVRRLTR